jgi:hypothetical protein
MLKTRHRFGSSNAELKFGTALKLRRAVKKLDSQTFKFASYVRINLLARDPDKPVSMFSQIGNVFLVHCLAPSFQKKSPRREAGS